MLNSFDLTVPLALLASFIADHAEWLARYNEEAHVYNEQRVQQERARERAAAVQKMEENYAREVASVQQDFSMRFGKSSFNAWVAGQAFRQDVVGLFAQGVVGDMVAFAAYAEWKEVMEHIGAVALSNFKAAWKDWKLQKGR